MAIVSDIPVDRVVETDRSCDCQLLLSASTWNATQLTVECK